MSVQLCISEPDVVTADSASVTSSPVALISRRQLLELNVCADFGARLFRTSEVLLLLSLSLQLALFSKRISG